MNRRIAILFVILGLIVLNVTGLAVTQKRSDFTNVELIVDTYHEIMSQYVEAPDANKISEAAVNAMLETLEDPYTSYFTKEEMTGFNKQVHGTFFGIGAEVEIRDERLYIVSPLQDSPAWNAGVLAGDTVLTVDGEDTKGLTITECIKRLTGPRGTKVTIVVRHLTGEEQTITIVRDKIVEKTVKGWRRSADDRWDHMLDENNKVGFVKLSKFTDSSAKDLFLALDNLKKKGMKGLIIDVRFNPGGLLSSAAEICDKFLPSGKRIVSTAGRVVPERVISATNDQDFPADIPIVIIANESSASASEILAGALSENGRAKFVGTRTYGKGSVQQVFPIENGEGAIKITNAYYYLPTGRNIHRRPKADSWGVDPDEGFYVPMTPQQMREMLERRRETTGPGSIVTKEVTPAWIEKDQKDPQLAAALKTMIAKIKTGEWQKVGKDNVKGLALAGQLDNLQRQRDFLEERLSELKDEIKRIRENPELALEEVERREKEAKKLKEEEEAKKLEEEKKEKEAKDENEKKDEKAASAKESATEGAKESEKELAPAGK